jgi:probable F420-dependent oxidoreductase
MTPNFAPEPIEAPPPPVMIAAVGPAMLKVAAEECDGVKLHGFCTRKYIEEAVMPRLAEGLTKAGRKRENYEISGGGFLATGPDDATVARMFEWVRERVAFYGSTQAYWPVLALHGLEELGHKLNAMTRQGKWNEMAKEVPDDVVHLFAAVGRYDQIVRAIEERFGGLTDALNARANTAQPGHLPRELIQDIRRVPHAFRSFKSANA